jgi:hypothetical protein
MKTSLTTMEHGGMKTPLTTFVERYTEWMNITWSMLTGVPLPAKESPAKAAPSAAEQEWEHEGGSIRQVKKPKLKPGRKARR